MRFRDIENRYRQWLEADGAEKERAARALVREAREAELDAVALGLGDEELGWLRNVANLVFKDESEDKLFEKLADLRFRMEHGIVSGPGSSDAVTNEESGYRPGFVMDYPGSPPEVDPERSRKRVNQLFEQLGLQSSGEDSGNDQQEGSDVE